MCNQVVIKRVVFEVCVCLEIAVRHHRVTIDGSGVKTRGPVLLEPHGSQRSKSKTWLCGEVVIQNEVRSLPDHLWWTPKRTRLRIHHYIALELARSKLVYIPSFTVASARKENWILGNSLPRRIHNLSP